MLISNIVIVSQDAMMLEMVIQEVMIFRARHAVIQEILVHFRVHPSSVV